MAEDIQYEVITQIKNLNNIVDIIDIDNIDERDKSKSIKKHYKHAQRWQLANTLTSLYGFDKALALMCEICDGTEYKLGYIISDVEFMEAVHELFDKYKVD